MTAQVVSIYDYRPIYFGPPSPKDQPATILILPVVLRSRPCCSIGCEDIGVTAIDVWNEQGEPAGSKFFCAAHEPEFVRGDGA